MPDGPPPNDRARLIVYRTGLKLGSAEARVQIDGKGTCGVASQDALAWDLSPGAHRLAVFTSSSPGASVLTVRFEAGKTVYVSVFVNGQRALATFFGGPIAAYAAADSNSPQGGGFVIEPVEAETAEKEIATMTKAGCPFQGGAPMTVKSVTP